MSKANYVVNCTLKRFSPIFWFLWKYIYCKLFSNCYLKDHFCHQGYLFFKFKTLTQKKFSNVASAAKGCLWEKDLCLLLDKIRICLVDNIDLFSPNFWWDNIVFPGFEKSRRKINVRKQTSSLWTRRNLWTYFK